MTTTSVSPVASPGAVVIDANVAVAAVSNQAGRETTATQALTTYASQGYEWFAPGAIVIEVLYALCQTHHAGLLTAVELQDAIRKFEVLMESILPPPDGESALVDRAFQIGASYGCSRSADSVYIALTEALSQTRPTVLLTFDQGLPNQASKNASTVTVRVL